MSAWQAIIMDSLQTFALQKIARTYLFAGCLILCCCYTFATNYQIEPHPDRFLLLDSSHVPNLSPGDTISLKAGNYLQIFLRGIHGTEDSAIVIRNQGGKVIISNNNSYGLAFHTCTHIKLLGSGSPEDAYGIVIDKTAGNGISFDMKSSDIEIAHVEIASASLSGIMIKTDPACDDPSTTRESFILQNVIVHQNLIQNTGNEGLYIGSSYYHPGMLRTCNGTDTLLLPHEIHGIRVFNNILQRTGRNAIQVSSATKRCQIYNNTIFEDSQRAMPYHMNGIQVGGGSCCDVFNNQIFDGKGGGIHYFGMGPAKIYNNLIVNPGRAHLPNMPANEYPVHGIFVKYIFSTTSDPIHIFHNTIVNPRTDAIRYENQHSQHNRIINNLLVNPGSFDHIRNYAFIHIDPPNTSMTISNNYFSINTEDIYFSDYLNSDFSLKPHSPAINKGSSINGLGIESDIAGYPRPFGMSPDIGAYEYQGFVPTNADGLPSLYIFPNPATDLVSLLFNYQHNKPVSITLYDISGKQVYNQWSSQYCPYQQIHISDLANGIYLIKVETGLYSAEGKFIKY